MLPLVDLRRQIHRNPEVAREEKRTTALVHEQLTEAGLHPQVFRHGTGLVADVGAEEGPVVVVRADLDALRVDDEKDVDYRSQVPGVAHACGHDVHTAILVGVARELARRPPDRGRVRLVFQPAEESPESGSLDAIDEGVLADAGRIVALHCDPSHEVGLVGLRPGPLTAAAGALTVALTGTGGHSARPALSKNPIEVGSALVRDLNDTVRRDLPAGETVQITFGSFVSGDSHNAIPTTATLRGSVRIPSREVWYRSPELVRAAVGEVAGPWGLEYEVDYRMICPPVVNDAATVASAEVVAHELFGPDGCYRPPVSMGGEDFSWYLEQVPGALFRLGTRRPGVAQGPDLHSGTFDVDESCIDVGVRFLSGVARRSLTDLAR